jgi:hypothetical protein
MLSALSALLEKYSIDPSTIGRLEASSLKGATFQTFFENQRPIFFTLDAIFLALMLHDEMSVNICAN